MREIYNKVKNTVTFITRPKVKETLPITEESFNGSEIMRNINTYYRNLTKEEIAAGLHRDMIGALWEEVGKLQFEFLKQAGLQPEHTLLDIGCGSMRGGLWFVDYLNSGNYAGLDINASLIDAGKFELEQAHLMDKKPALLVNNQFEFWRFERKFDYAIAVSVFTHLNFNYILGCLAEVKKVMGPNSKFYATFFEAPSALYLPTIRHIPGDAQTNYAKDPFHQSLEEFKWFAQISGLKVEYVGDWNHPRSQKFLCFTL